MDSETSKDDLQFLYEKAIEGRAEIWHDFNHWMNMYAIFNGALFVGFYNIPNDVDSKSLITILILFLGCIEAIFWHCSARGFYRWIRSWIGVVSFYETRLSENPVYRAFVHLGKEDDAHPFSTQKLTLWFTGCVMFAWGVLLCKSVYCFLKSFDCLKNIEVSVLIISIVAVVFVIGIAIFLVRFFCREDIKESHQHFLQKKYGEYCEMQS